MTGFLLISAAVLLFVGLPIAFIWGWVRWLRRAKSRDLFSRLSVAGFVLATVSGVFAVGSAIYAGSIGGYAYFDPRLIAVFRIGLLLSISAAICALVGAWKPGPVRWHAAVCAVGVLLFWMAAAAAE